MLWSSQSFSLSSTTSTKTNPSPTPFPPLSKTHSSSCVSDADNVGAAMPCPPCCPLATPSSHCPHTSTHANGNAHGVSLRAVAVPCMCAAPPPPPCVVRCNPLHAAFPICANACGFTTPCVHRSTVAVGTAVSCRNRGFSLPTPARLCLALAPTPSLHTSQVQLKPWLPLY